MEAMQGSTVREQAQLPPVGIQCGYTAYAVLWVYYVMQIHPNEAIAESISSRLLKL